MNYALCVPISGLPARQRLKSLFCSKSEVGSCRLGWPQHSRGLVEADPRKRSSKWGTALSVALWNASPCAQAQPVAVLTLFIAHQPRLTTCLGHPGGGSCTHAQAQSQNAQTRHDVP